MMVFELLLFVASLAAGATASISGFGIGSVLTPLVSIRIDTKVAVAIVSFPHLVGTLVRFIRLRKHINRRVAFSFGTASAVGGLGGALLNAYASGPALSYILGTLLVFAGLSGITGFADHLRLSGPWLWIAGLGSAALGGLVGNQGGIRSAAMLGFHLTKESFVATGTAIALVVDAARVPVYFATQKTEILQHWPIITLSTVGVVIGTLAGSLVLERIPERTFKRLVSALIFCLGLFMLFRPASD
jgi:uncharacterized protein